MAKSSSPGESLKYFNAYSNKATLNQTVKDWKIGLFRVAISVLDVFDFVGEVGCVKPGKGRPSTDFLMALTLFSLLEVHKGNRGLIDEIGRFVSHGGELHDILDKEIGPFSFDKLNLPKVVFEECERWERSFKNKLRQRLKRDFVYFYGLEGKCTDRELLEKIDICFADWDHPDWPLFVRPRIDGIECLMELA